MSKPETVNLVYGGEHAVIVPDAGLTAEPGSTVPIPAELAASLIGRDEWSKPEKKAQAPAKERD